MPNHVRAVFLDAGLTLVYSDLLLADLCYEVGREHGLHATMEALEAAIPSATADMHHVQRSDPEVWSSDARVQKLWVDYYSAVLRGAGIEADPDTLDACSLAIYRRYIVPGAWKLYPDVLPTLSSLHSKGYTLGVISDWGNALISKVLLPLGVGRYIDFMVVSSVQREAKPGSGLYREALARAGVEAGEAIHVGDNYITDVLGARSAGIRGILLDRDGMRRDMALDCPRIESLEELVGLVEG